MDFLNKILNQLAYIPDEPMIFNSGFFIFFFFVCILFYRVFFTNYKARAIYLMLFSLFFYYKSSGIYFILILVSSFIDYIAAIYIHESSSKTRKKILLVLSVITNFAILGYFKYTNFFFETLGDLNLAHFDAMDIFLPVGISFFTFQSLSYTIDVYRGILDPERDYWDFLFFVSFFPQLVAGPIVRAKDFLPQLRHNLTITQEDLGRAVYLIAAGLFKKAVIADFISINFVDRVFEMPTRYTGFENLMALYGYALQIYCDFSGYSDMAIGLALLMGFKLNINFNSPYQAASITEFWHRWHISLSTWLKDYLYIPLGGNKKGKFRQYINLLITMLLGGLWHGANWKFVIWGGIHGLALAFEKLFNWPNIVKKNKFAKILGVFITFHIVCLCWIFFRADSFQTAMEMIDQIFNFFHGEVYSQFLEGYPFVTLLIVIGFILHFIPPSIELKSEKLVGRLPLLAKALVIVFVVYLVIQVKSSDIHPFIYFQF